MSIRDIHDLFSTMNEWLNLPSRIATACGLVNTSLRVVRARKSRGFKVLMFEKVASWCDMDCFASLAMTVKGLSALTPLRVI